MASQFLDPNVLKDDASLTSSMDDSTYMSQPDTARHPGTTAQSRDQQNPRRTSGGFLVNHVYSPALSSPGLGGYNGTPSDTSQLYLPPHAPEAEMGSFAMGDFTNYPPQYYRRSSGFDVHGQSAHPLPLDRDGPIRQGSWPTSDVHNFSRPFAVPHTDALSTPSHHDDLSSGEYMRQPFFHNQREGVMESHIANFGNQPLTAAGRPIVRRIDTSSTQSDPAQRRSSLTGYFPEMAPHSAASQRSASLHGPHFVDASALRSPSSVISDRKSSLTAGEVKEEHHFFVDGRAMESMTSPTRFHDVGEDEHHSSSCSTAHPLEDEVDVKRARSHPLYQATPQANDLYYCPFKTESKCNHNATKLKCNYDKYVDSHLKPFRCKVVDCVEVQFSSTACLLRHEREAHAMHGHGAKPHLCYYRGCERSFPGHGFPRRYNLFDHMKRLHGHVEQPTSPEPVSAPPSSHTVSTKKPAPRKRKSEGAAEQPEKRTRTGSKSQSGSSKMPPPQQNKHEQLRRRLQAEWDQRRVSAQRRLEILQGPADIACLQQLSDDVAALKDLARKIADTG